MLIKHSPIHALALPVFAVLSFGITAPGVAQTTDQPRRIVKVTPADLISTAGRASIDGRIVRAARQVCTHNAGTRLLFTSSEMQCRASATAEARRQLDQRVAAATGGVQIAATNDVPVSR